MEVFIELAKRASFSRAEVKKLASAIGWQGCYGFNRLIHYHTDVAKLFVIKNSQDVSYSGKHYATEEDHSRSGSSICSRISTVLRNRAVD